MPSDPILDPSQLDFAASSLDRDAIAKVLPHRGRFLLLDGILTIDPNVEWVAGYKEIRSDDWWAEDHIPGRPIFPGVLMCEAAAQLCSVDFSSRRTEVADQFVGFGGMNSTRFRGTVTPDCRLIFVARVKRLRSSMFTYETQGFVDNKLVFETEIMGVVV